MDVIDSPHRLGGRATVLRFGENSLLVLGLMDLLYNKLEADRPKDRDFIQEAIICKLADVDAEKVCPGLRTQRRSA